MLWQIRKCEAFLGAFELDEVAVQLNLVLEILFNGKAQENRSLARVALIYETDVFGPVMQ